MLNGEFANEQAAALPAGSGGGPERPAGPGARAVRLTTGRVPAADEVAKDVAFVRSLAETHGLDDTTAWHAVRLLALNANEFVYLD
jgi:hypothetical protein